MSTFNGYVSNAVVYGVDEAHGYPFEEATVVFQLGMTVGSLLKLTSSGYEWAATADAANVVGVLADARVEATDGIPTAGNYVLVVAVRACGLGKTYLQYSDGAVDAAGITALTALGMKVEDQY